MMSTRTMLIASNSLFSALLSAMDQECNTRAPSWHD